MSNNLARFESEDGIELVIDIVTGEAFATQSGYVRMSGKDKSTISRRVNGVASGVIKTGEIQTPGGLQGVALIPAELVFEWLLDDNRKLALKMGEAGATVYIYQLAKYKVTVTAIEPVNQPTQAEVDEYHLNLRKLSGVKRLITRLELKYNFNDLHSIVKNFPHHNDLNPFYSYSSIIVNQCYVRVFAGNKLSLSGRLGLEYSRELNIRDHICLESLDALLTFENYLNQAITGLGYNPYDALDIAENLMKTDPKWKHIKLPVECKRAPSITCPSTFSEEDWLNHWKYELTGLERLIQKHLLMFRENSNNPLPIS